MLERLSEGPATVSTLARPLTISLAAVVQHVQVLEASGLIRTEKVGRQRTCAIAGEAVRSAEGWLTDRRALWERRLDNLGRYLADGEVVGRSARSATSHPASRTKNTKNTRNTKKGRGT